MLRRLSRLIRRDHDGSQPVPAADGDLAVRSLLDDPGLRRAMGLDVDEQPAEPITPAVAKISSRPPRTRAA